MDKWKDLELEKMKVGGNRTFRMFLELQDDYDPSWNLQEKYNSKVAALFRDKVRRSDIRNTLCSSSIDLMTLHRALECDQFGRTCDLISQGCD